MKLAIVGADARAWGNIPNGEKKAREKIKEIIVGHGSSFQEPDRSTISFDGVVIVSGHCPQGGVDIWAEEIAKELGIKTEIYPAEVHQWNDKIIPRISPFMNVVGNPKLKGYRSRNIQIAKACDVLYDIEPASSCKYCRGTGYLSKGVFTPKHLTKPYIPSVGVAPIICPKCEGDGAYSGGTWTLKYARKLGKKVHKVIIT